MNFSILNQLNLKNRCLPTQFKCDHKQNCSNSFQVLTTCFGHAIFLVYKIQFIYLIKNAFNDNFIKNFQNAVIFLLFFQYFFSYLLNHKSVCFFFFQPTHFDHQSLESYIQCLSSIGMVMSQS